MKDKSKKSVAVIVAHPDDETLWAGGTILRHPDWNWFIVCLCRGNDPERAPRFFKALKILHAQGVIGDLDDSPTPKKLTETEVENAVLQLLPPQHFDLVISHNPSGEYTRHIRHEEISKAVIDLWHADKIKSDVLWTFAYEDGNGAYFPLAVKGVTIYRVLTKNIWLGKYSLVTETYGFDKTTWEAQTTPKAEAFRQFTDPGNARAWLNDQTKVQ